MKINPKQMQQMMKRMGIAQVELDAKEVIIRLDDKELVFQNPSVSKVNMMGQTTFQVVGNPVEQAISEVPDIKEEDIQTVIEQTGVSEDKAREVLQKNKGDIAETILELKE